MRVLSISTLFPSSARPGFGLFVERQASALAGRDDIDLTVVSPVPQFPGPLSRAFHGPEERAVPLVDRSRGYPVHHPRFTWIPRLGARWNPALVARAVLPLARRLHAEQPFDVVDAQFFHPDGPAAARVARALGLPLSIKARGSDIHHWGHVPHARRQMLEAAREATGMLAVSAALRADMVALGMPAERIAVHYTGLDHALFQPLDKADARAKLAEDMAIPASGRLVVSTGNLIALKGQALVIRALAELGDTRLLLAGSGPDQPALEALARELGLAERVHISRLSPAQLALALGAADAMALPSEREGLANAWIEGLACGTPLVVTDVGGAREVVTSPTAGRLVERNPGAIASALRSIFANPPAPCEVAAHAARFSWEANAAQLADHFRKLAGKA